MRVLGLLFVLLCAPFSMAYAEQSAADPSAALAAEGIYSLPATGIRGAGAFSDNAGRTSVIILFQPDCPWCHAQFKRAEAFAAQYPNVSVLAVSLRGTRRDLLDELRRARTKLPAYRSSPALIEALGSPEGTPRVFVLSADGALVAQARGMQEADELAALLTGLSAD